MRRFIFTSHLFKGFVEAIYNVDGILWKISFSNTTAIEREHIKWFKNAIPVMVENIEGNFANAASIKIEEKDFEVLFEDFKREYPYSRNMHLVARDWINISNGEKYLIFIGSISYNKYCIRNKKWYKPMLPMRFIKDKEYLNNWDNL